MLNGPVKAYFDASKFDKAALSVQIEEDLYRMRTQYKQNAKFLTGAFQDLISLTNALQGLSKKQAMNQLQSVGIEKNTEYVCKLLAKIHESKGAGSKELENLLKQVHYGQLINFDYKFASKSFLFVTYV